MNNVNKTLYIPLYGKAYVSKKGILLSDKKAEEIWEKEGFTLKGKSRSKWLAYYMGMRSAMFDSWVKETTSTMSDAVIVHIGCGMDSRAMRIGNGNNTWYDVDFPEVITERKRYYEESASYRMIGADARESAWLSKIPETKSAIIILEGVSMYLSLDELQALFANLCAHFDKIALLMDCYTVLAAKMSKYKNPINDVGVTKVYGIDDPELLCVSELSFVKEHDMTPSHLIDELEGMEKRIFKKLYAGSFSKKLYKTYEYKKQ